MIDRSNLRYMQTWSGRHFFPADPRPEDFCIDDVAHHLSLINRFTGATKHPYSVGQHSLNCSYMASCPTSAYEALLHDRSEGYISDVNSPSKYYLPDYQALERVVEEVSAITFNVPAEMSEEVKVIDFRMLVTEASVLMKDGVYAWWNEPYWQNFPAYDLNEDSAMLFHSLQPTDVERWFLSRYYELREMLGYV
jgi:5'-deoxynucleotidase YfbR-like HD superfamily hydrolase